MNGTIKIVLPLIFGLLFAACSSSELNEQPVYKKKDSIVTDTINEAFLKDSSLFLTVSIGNQTWMKSDLRLTEFLNGDPISEAKSNDDWIKYARLKKPCYRKYGNSIFYNGYAIMDERGLIPEDFKIPSASDWDILMNELGGIIPMSKSISTYNWSEKNQGETVEYEGNNSSEFAALPTGFIYTSGSISYGNCSFWWVNSSGQSLIPTKLSIFNIGFCDSEVSRGMMIDPAFGATLRCIKKSI
jgi:uncharacterized protein (TIGR02145 family)